MRYLILWYYLMILLCIGDDTLTNQTAPLIAAVKKQLKIRGYNYRNVANHLNVSEVTVKRLFSAQNLSLKRLEQLCELLEMSFYDLAKLASAVKENHSVLTLQQEQSLADNPLLLVYFYLIINGWLPAAIENHYKVQLVEGIKLLTTLDKLKLIELLPGNRVRPLTSRTINWLPHGPVRKLHEAHAKAEFLAGDFNLQNDRFSFQFGELSVASRDILTLKLKKLLREFNDLVDIDLHLPQAQKSSVGLLVATRPWVFSVLNQFMAKIE
jgi:DNA-binding Xre family transcriptional regulator